MEFLDVVEEKAEAGADGPGDAQPLREQRLLGRREEAQRDPADGGARAEAGDPRRDRLGPRHRRAAHRGRRRELAQEPRARDDRRHALPAPAQLHRARLRARAGRRPHREVGRQGAGARARGARLRLAARRRRPRDRTLHRRSGPGGRRPRSRLAGRATARRPGALRGARPAHAEERGLALHQRRADCRGQPDDAARGDRRRRRRATSRPTCSTTRTGRAWSSSTAASPPSSPRRWTACRTASAWRRSARSSTARPRRRTASPTCWSSTSARSRRRRSTPSPRSTPRS